MENQNSQEGSHKRRVRYQGSYPKRYQEKYKELQPEKYRDTVLKVISKGSTPAGMHRPICVKEILDFLKIQPGQTGLDATLGYGGHTLEMLKCMDAQGHLYALDVDPVESGKTKERLKQQGYGEECLTVIQENFANIKMVCEKTGKFDFILADLGVSSMQIDNPERGFSYKTHGPLDLRLNPEAGTKASERLLELDYAELVGMLTENADEPFAEEIADVVTQKIKRKIPISTTTDFRNCIEEALQSSRAFQSLKKEEQKEMLKKSCQRSFQALRIDVNREFEVLEQFLLDLPGVLQTGGKAAILTFHSGEDRLVKKTFQRLYQEGLFREIAREVIRPSAEECRENPRARSTKMRWAVRA